MSLGFSAPFVGPYLVLMPRIQRSTREQIGFQKKETKFEWIAFEFSSSGFSEVSPLFPHLLVFFAVGSMSIQPIKWVVSSVVALTSTLHPLRIRKLHRLRR